jgi:hypothetical protein
MNSHPIWRFTKAEFLMRMPDFIIIGAQKSGTTALHHALKQHPQISMHRQKEPEFFTYEGVQLQVTDPASARWNRWICTNLEAYQEGFVNAKPATQWGEASTAYLNSYRTEQTAANIYRYNPNTRLVAVLRHPADRAYSAFNYYRQIGLEPFADFQMALESESDRQQQNWHRSYYYRQNGCYARLLTPYFARFPKNQLRIYLYEDWNTQPKQVLQDIYQFLEIEEIYPSEQMGRLNQSMIPRSAGLQHFLDRLPDWAKRTSWLLPGDFRRAIKAKVKSLNQVVPQPLNPDVRAGLIASYREDILLLQSMLNRSLAHWLL